MVGILSLKPEDENKVHPEAIRWFNARRAEIQFEVPLEELSDDDLDTFLSDDEKRKFIRYKDEITRGLITCINLDEASHDLVTNATIGLSILKFQVNSLLLISKIGLLLKDVHRRKVTKAKQEQMEQDVEETQQASKARQKQRRREEEDEERRAAAFKAVEPPVSDASKYLKPEEYKEFKQSISRAVDAFLDNPESYLSDKRVYDYRQWCREIKSRRETEEPKIAAESKAREYNARLNKEIAGLKSVLCPDRKDHESYFKKQISDRRYTGHSFTQYLSSEEKMAFDETIVDVSRKKLDEIVSGDFRQFVDSKCLKSYFLLPSAEYSLEGVPCLDFMFDVFIVVETRVWLKPRQKNFGDYIFDLPWREEKGYSVVLQEPEFLGYHYLVLTPEDLGGYSLWQSIPLVLIKRLLDGKTKPGGFTITAATNGMITYKIPKFKDVVNIPDDFAGYLRSIGSIDEMVSMGIMIDKVADIVKSEAGELEVEQKASLSEEKGRDSKKARAFQLFSQGEGPSSPEVKALRLHKSTRFKYYNQYLVVHKP